MSFKRIAVSVVALLFICKASGQEEDEGPYKGKLIGKLNSYHHQVSGDIYAVDKYTILLTSFNYDGNGADTFFWAGAANRPGPQGFIVPDEHGKTNVLSRYYNKEFTLVLPDKKKITDIKWFAIYDIGSQNTFADIYIPEEFEPPMVQRVPQLTGKLNGISTIAVEILDAKQIKLIGFSYSNKVSKAYFWVGVGAQPVSKGTQVPDEYGYLDPLKSYNNKTIILELPGELTIFNIDWFSIFDRETNTNLASIIIPEALNVPPSLIEVVPHKDALPNCIQLHKDFQVSWEIFGPAITIQLAGMVSENEYLSFGISGSQERSQMLGADVAVGYINGYQGYAIDYNITALTPCVKVLGQYKGVCKDELVGGQENNQMNTAVRANGVNIITYRRSLISSDSGDKEFPSDGSVYVTWAMGKLDENKEPAYHDVYPKTDLKIELNPKEPIKSCSAFTRSKREMEDPWSKGQIFDKAIRIFKATIGPSGGKKGYQAITGHTSTALAWYINGLLAPELWLRRGLTYLFKVNGGNDPHSPEYYHPLIITDDPHGGYDRLTDIAQSKVRVLAGVEYSRRGRPKSTASGPLCLSKHKDDADRRLDDDFESFKKFNRSLVWSCEPGDPGILEFTPNSSWPDIVYYNSFTQANMGWKIHIIDSFNQRATSDSHQLVSNCWLVIVIMVFIAKYL
ncbi:protein Skeletor, isoforms B/C isoform X2 [Anthonomus grandis grandis]|uniref:protein Skeletor, isoforms B/C isoform X2 n=1 Tax=Anthonomus grandis grandis TaxID=2921223 RepID=UPI002165E65A|nr:protein Skeletor, isoforms B/C isoform X2 [Anthonomus grandis grandis]